MTARRALKSLETLARARDLELTELRREAARVMDRLERTIAAIEGLKSALRTEGESLGGDPAMMSVYAKFAAGARQRLTALAAARESLELEVDQADERVAEGYRALKQIEQAADARRQEILDEEARKERATADDLAAIRAMRGPA